MIDYFYYFSLYNLILKNILILFAFMMMNYYDMIIYEYLNMMRICYFIMMISYFIIFISILNYYHLTTTRISIIIHYYYYYHVINYYY